MATHRLARSVVLPFALLFWGCAENSPTEPLPAEDRGTYLGPSAARGLQSWEYAQIEWSPGGDEIYHVVGPEPGTQIIAVDVATGARRTLVSRGTSVLRLTVDGQWLFASHRLQGPVDRFDIVRYRVAGGPPLHVAEAASEVFAATPAGDSIVYVPETGIAVVSVNGGAPRSLLPSYWHPLGVSPDSETALLWGGERGLVRARLADGDTTLVWTLPTQMAPVDHPVPQWRDGALVRVLHTAGTDLWLFEEAVGSRRAATLGGLGEHPSIGWSPDGSRAAVWAQGRCVDQGEWICELAQWRLYLIDLATGAVSETARANLPEWWVARPVFSPDGHRLAYVIDGGLYVRDLP